MACGYGALDDLGAEEVVHVERPGETPVAVDHQQLVDLVALHELHRLDRERLVVRQDAEGFQLTSATGAPVRFKQKQDPKEGEKEGRWMDGEALRVEIDERKQTIELFDNARVNRGGDAVAGAYIFVDERSDFFQVTASKGGRRRMARLRAA